MSKRKLVWARVTLAQIALTAAADAEAADFLTPFRSQMGILMNLPGTTISRVHVNVFAANLSAGGLPLFVGLKVATMREAAEAVADPAFALTTGPQGEPNADWMMWRALYPNLGQDPVTGVPNATVYDIDVRSMRRLDEAQETLVFYAQKPLSTGGYTVFVSASILLALP